MDELVRRYVNATADARQVTTDVHAPYFGIKVNDHSLTPGDHPRNGDSLTSEKPLRLRHE